MSAPKPFLIEAVVDSVEAALAAQHAGADRLELCSGLETGGLTPGRGLMEMVCAETSIPVFVLLRTRGGDFHYNETEFRTLVDEVRHARLAGAAGIVVGALTPEGRIHVPWTQRLVEAAGPLSVTFHRAFDRTRNLEEAWADLLETGCNRVLTSGMAGDAFTGRHNLAWLQRASEASGRRVDILPGGGISSENVRQIAAETGVREFHFSGIRQVASKMDWHPKWVHAQAENWVPAPEKVRAIRQQLVGYFSEIQ